jgi:hypothetical protein
MLELGAASLEPRTSLAAATLNLATVSFSGVGAQQVA